MTSVRLPSSSERLPRFQVKTGRMWTDSKPLRCSTVCNQEPKWLQVGHTRPLRAFCSLKNELPRGKVAHARRTSAACLTNYVGERTYIVNSDSNLVSMVKVERVGRDNPCSSEQNAAI